MARVYVTAERVIPAPPDVVFAFLCDYQRDRPKILPANYQHYRVTAGGVGGGTGTEWQGGRGVGGFFERTFAPVGLRRIYGEMLDRLATAATSPAAGAA